MKALMIIAHETFRDEEYSEPRRVLEEAGVSVFVASTASGPATGKLGMMVQPDVLLTDSAVDAFDAIIFVGGGGAEGFFHDEQAHRLAKEAVAAGKLLAAICIAPAILAYAGLLSGRRVTAFPSVEVDLRQNGAVYTGAAVETDGKLITANGPEAAEAFGKAIAVALKC